MHAFRRYISDGMSAHQWTSADFARASKLSPQHVSQLLNDSRESLPSVPKRETILAVARAFSTNESHVMTYVFEAMGYSIEDVRQGIDLSGVRSRDLLEALAARLPDEGEVDGTSTKPAGPKPGDDELSRRRGAGEAVVTTEERRRAARKKSSGKKPK